VKLAYQNNGPGPKSLLALASDSTEIHRFDVTMAITRPRTGITYLYCSVGDLGEMRESDGGHPGTDDEDSPGWAGL